MEALYMRHVNVMPHLHSSTNPLTEFRIVKMHVGVVCRVPRLPSTVPKA